MDFEALQTRMGYSFQNQALLSQALHHPSLSKTKEASPFERLEFLGDRVLGLGMAHWLYTLYPEEAEGPLAIRHSSLVGRPSLFLVALNLELKEVLRCDQQLGHPRLYEKILADSCEALLGAIFLDGGFEQAEEKIKEWWSPFVRAQKKPPVNSKSLLQEWAQERQKPKPLYSVLEISGPPHQPLFKVRVTLEGFPAIEGWGSSKKKAELMTAEAMLDILKQENLL